MTGTRSSTSAPAGPFAGRGRRLFAAVAALATVGLALPATPALAQEKLRISLDTNPTHVRNRGVDMFVAELKKRTGDRFAIEVYPSGQLFRDRDVPKALRQGAIEMAVPGTWQLDGVEPNAAIQTLPMFYGVPGDVVHQVMDGKLGRFISQRMEDRLKVKVLGDWFDLGMQHFFSMAKPVASYDDLKGMKIRSPGGTANAARFKGLGGSATLVPFPDLPLAMSQGVIDAMATTWESAFTSKLNESGLKHAFEDDQYFGQYIPMVSQTFWAKQPKDVQDAFVAAWAAAARDQRDMAAKAQAHARTMLIEKGVKAVQATAAEKVERRKQLMAMQDDLVKEMKIDRDTVEAALDGLRAAKVAF